MSRQEVLTTASRSHTGFHPARNTRRSATIPSTGLTETQLATLQIFAGLLKDGQRLRIVAAIRTAQFGELHVTAICNAIGASQPVVSHHLSLLRVSGILESRREGKHNFYRLSTSLAETVELVRALVTRE